MQVIAANFTSEVQTLRFIRIARDLGFPVEQIAELLRLWSDLSRHSAGVKRLAAEPIAGLRRRIAEIEGMVHALGQPAECCAGDGRPECPVLDDLETAVLTKQAILGSTTFGRP